MPKKKAVHSPGPADQTAIRMAALLPLPDDDIYIRPVELARRWHCSRSSVDRIARQANFRRLLLGDGRNGTVRYLRKEVIDYENRRLI